MATLDQANELGDSLHYDVLSRKLADLLKEKEAAERERNEQHNDLQRVRSELESAQARASQLQLQTRQVTIKYESCSASERKLSDQLAIILSELSTTKESNKELVNKNNQLTKDWTDITFQKQQLEEDDIKHKTCVEHMEKRIESLVFEKAQAQKQLLETQEAARLLRETQAQTSSMAAVERLNLERQSSELQSANQDLRLKLTETQRVTEEVSSENIRLKQKLDVYKDTETKMRKDHKELYNYYEKRLSEAEAERDSLRSTVEETNRQLQNVERQMRSEQPRVGNSVFGRYEEEHRKVIIERDGLKALIGRLENESKSKDAKCEKLVLDNQELRTQLDSLKPEAPMRRELAVAEQQQRELQETNTHLETQLKDTTYQLRYLLREMQARDVVLPAEIQSFPNTDMCADITPSLAHDKVVFRDVDELHQQNTRLIMDLYKVNKELNQTVKQFDLTRQLHEKTKVKQDQKIHQYEANNQKLLSTVQSLKTRLSEANQKQLLSEKALLENIKRTSPFINTEAQQQLAGSKERIRQLESKNDSAYQDMLQNVHRIRKDYEKAVLDATTANVEREKIQTELIHVKQEHSRLVHAVSVHANRERELHTLNHDLQQRINDNAIEYTKQGNELISIRSAAQSLEQQKTQISFELQSSNNRIEQLSAENQKLIESRNQTNALLQSVTASKATGERPEKLNALLKTRIETQQRDLALLRDKCETINKELQEYTQREAQHWKPQLVQLEKDLARIRGERIQMNKELAETKDTCHALETKLAKSERETKDALLLANNGDPEQLHLKLSGAKAEIDELQSQIAEYESRLNSINQEMEQARHDRTELVQDTQGRLAKAHSALQERNLRIKEMEAQVEENESLKKEKTELEQDYQSEKERAAVLQGKQASQQEEIQQLQAQVVENTQHAEQLDRKLAAANLAHDTDKQNLRSLHSKVQELSKAYTESRTQLSRVTTELKESQLAVFTEKEASEAAQKSLRLSLEQSRMDLANLAKVHDELLTTVADTQKSSLSPAEQGKLIVDLSNRTSERLREINLSLRHENDVLHSKCSEARQEAERATTHLEVIRKQYEATRVELDNVRHENLRMQDDYSTSALDARMEASTFKEDNKRLQQKASEFEDLVSKLKKNMSDKESQLGPLKERVRVLEADSKTHQETVKLVEKEKERWQAWTEQVLSKSNRVDPAVFQRYKDECEALKKQLEEHEAAKSTFISKSKDAESKQAELTTQLKEANDKVNKLQNIAGSLNAKWKAAKEKLAKAANPDTEAINDKSTDEKYQKLQAEKDQVQTALNARINAHTELQRKHKDLMAKAHKLLEEKKKATEELQTAVNERDSVQQQLQKLTDELNETTKKLSRAKVKESVDTNKITKLQAMIESHKRERDQEDGEISDRESKIPKSQ